MEDQVQFGTGVVLFDVPTFSDARGRFEEVYRQSVREVLPSVAQVNYVSSTEGVLRGLHYQRAPHAQAKYIHVAAGVIFDVAVDLRDLTRPYAAVTLRPGQALYVPSWCAHGYLAITPVVAVTYLTSAEYAPESEAGIRWDDPLLGIKWPVKAPLLSARDREWPLLATTLALA